MLSAYGMHPREVQAARFAWAETPNGPAVETDIPCGVHVSDRLTEVLLPALADELGTREIIPSTTTCATLQVPAVFVNCAGALW